MRRLFEDKYYIVLTSKISYLKPEKNPLINNNDDLLKYSELIEAVRKRGYTNYINSERRKYLKNWIWYKTPLLSNFYDVATHVVWILNGMQDFPKCPTCGHQFGINQNVTFSEPYFDHCSSKCSNNDLDVINRIGDSIFEKYGARSYAQTAGYREKSKATFIKHYGVDNNMKCEKGRKELRDAYKAKTGYEHNWQNPESRRRGVETAKALYGEDYKRHDLVRQTNMKKFGTPYYFQTKEFKDKSRKTNRKNWGTDFSAQSEQVKFKIRLSTMDHLGVPYSMMNAEVKRKRVETYRSIYGVDHPMQCSEMRRSVQKRYVYDGIHFDSKPEIAFYVWLKDYGVDFKYQPDECFDYEFDGMNRRYFPDFKVGDRFYEIKGDHMISESGAWICPWDHSHDAQYDAKRKCAEANGVVVLTSNEYAKYLKYIDEKYGRGWLDQFKNIPSEK